MKKRDSNDTFWRRTVYADSGTFTTKATHYETLVEDPVKKGERLLAGDRDAWRLDDERKHISELPRTGSRTAEIEEVHRQVALRREAQERLNKLNPVLQLLVMFWRVVVVYWMRVKRFHTPIIFGSVGVVAIGVIWALVATITYFTATYEGTVTVAERHWERSVEVERFTTLQHDDWTYPADARVLSSREEFHHNETDIIGYKDEHYTEYESQLVGYESYEYPCGSETSSNGDGTFSTTTQYCEGSRPNYEQVAVDKTRQVPITQERAVYKTKYVYEVDRWVTSRWVRESDKTSDEVVWPEVTDLQPRGSLGGRMGEEHVGKGRVATYSVVYVDANNKQDSDNVEEEIWNKIEVGETITARYYERNDQLASVTWDAVLQPTS